MTELEMFKNNWKPNYSDSSYECFCFRTDLNKLVEEIRTDEREKMRELMPNCFANKKCDETMLWCEDCMREHLNKIGKYIFKEQN